MSTADDLTAAINAKGEEIRILKAEKPPTLKDDLAPLIAELLALKVSYKEITGEDFGGVKPPEEKKKKDAQQEETVREGPSKSELNKLKRKEQKLAKRAEDRGTEEEEVTKIDTSSAAAVEAGGDEALAHLYGDVPLVRQSQ